MNKNLLDEIDFIKSKIIEKPIYYTCTWSRCGGASCCGLIETIEQFDDIIKTYRKEYASKWDFIFDPIIYLGPPKAIFDIIWTKYNSYFDYYLIQEPTVLLRIEDLFHALWSWDRYKKPIKLLEVNTEIIDLRAFMPDEKNEVVTGSY